MGATHRRRRGHAAAAGRILAAGLSSAAGLGMVAGMAVGDAGASTGVASPVPQVTDVAAPHWTPPGTGSKPAPLVTAPAQPARAAAPRRPARPITRTRGS